MSCVCVVVDCNACNWGALVEKHGKSNFNSLITSIVGFCNAQLSLSMNNHLLLLAAAPNIEENVLYSSSNSPQRSDVAKTIDSALRQVIRKSAEVIEGNAITKFSSTLSISICFIERCKRELANSFGRILMISLANDLSAEQNVLMNLFFAAHQHNIIVDVASLGDPIPILQQASDITAGTHMFIEKPELLLKDLMQNCLVNSSESHEVFNRSDPTIIDYRAACHCHHKLVQIGYVCSVCLTIQCVFTPICPTCNAIFSLPTTGPKKAKKRKKDA